MPHLSLETLARLIDEAPTAAESRHLEMCIGCRDEFDALRSDQIALGELPDLLPPPAGAWPALEERLRDEGLIRTRPAEQQRAGNRHLRLAASLALFLLGGISGFMVRGGGEAGSAATAGAAIDGAPISSSLASPSISAFPASGATARNAAAAARALREAETAYHEALAQYAELSADLATDPMARLAALENIVITTRDALAAAPADPLINGYHITALAQRDATVRQISLASNDRWY